MKRRDFIRYGSFLSAGLLLPPWAAMATAAGEKVYLHLSQRELDDAYSDAKWAPNMRELLGRQAAAGARVRASFPPRTAGYGEGPAEKIDVFAPRGAAGGLPALIFIHGGNWRVGTKESVSCLAPPFLEHGAVFAAPEFDSIPANTLPGMADQCARAIVWVWRHARELGVDPDRIFVGGHSAGGHLAAVMLTTDWTRYNAPRDLLKGGLVLSGLCDLEPVVLAAGNRHLKLTAQERVELSPVHKLGTVRCPVIVAWGSGDSPEFQRQGMLMARHLRTAGRLAGTYTLQGVNHFEILDVMASARSPLAAATLALMG